MSDCSALHRNIPSINEISVSYDFDVEEFY
jgi:hypothetical protein